jgi:hypothetical protein
MILLAPSKGEYRLNILLNIAINLFCLSALTACQSAPGPDISPQNSPSKLANSQPSSSPIQVPTQVPTSTPTALPTNAASTSFELNQTFSLKWEQIQNLKDTDLKLTWTKTPEDSRCPTGAQCVWAGQVKVIVAVSKGSESVNLAFKLPGEGSQKLPSEMGDYTLELTDVLPYPSIKNNAESEERQLKLKLTQP